MGKKTENKLQQEIARRAARLIAIDDARDLLTAKRKAAQQLGVREKKYLPSNIEIESALVDYQRLFHGDEHEKLLRELRLLAIDSMQKFRQYNPRLTGPVLNGTANRNSEITLHLYSDKPEEILFYLMNNGIPYESCDRRIRISRNNTSSFPAYRFIAGQTPVVLTVFPLPQQHNPPLDPVDGRPMQRASESEIRSLVNIGSSLPSLPKVKDVTDGF